MDDVTCAKWSSDGNLLAFGDEKGAVKIIHKVDGEWKVKYSNDNLLGGAVNDISFSDDNKKIVVVGGGGQRAKAVNIETNSNVGEMTGGHTMTLLSCDIRQTKPFGAVATGEDKEIQAYNGPPFKLAKSI